MEPTHDKRNVIDEFKGLSCDRVRSLYDERSLPLIVAVESLKGTLNLGVLIRSSNAFGASRVIYFGRKKRDRRSEVGAAHHFPVEYRDLDYLHMLANNYLIVGVENNVPNTVNYSNFVYPKKTVLLMGSEECGLSDEAKAVCDVFVTIPQIGSVRSLNCSVAGSIIIADYVRKNLK